MLVKNIKSKKIFRSPLAAIHSGAEIHPSVEIGPFVTIEDDVVIDEGTWIGPNAVIHAGSRIGKNCQIFSGAIIGSTPQDLKFKGEYTQVVIGDRTSIREYATINRGTSAKNKTIIGSDVLIMAYSHVGHDSKVGNHVIIANATHLAGEVWVDDFATISAGVLIHQFSRIGSHVMIQGGSKVTKDIPPFIKVGRDPLTYMGINSIGLRRKDFSNERVEMIQQCYRFFYHSGLNTSQAISMIHEYIASNEDTDKIVEFVGLSERGIVKK